MNKQVFLITVLVLSSIIFNGCNLNSNSNKYLDYPFDKGKSNIRIDCKVDNDCKIVNITGWNCGGFKAINIINSEINWNDYNKKASEIEDKLGIIYDCDDLLNENINLKAICNKNNICEIKYEE